MRNIDLRNIAPSYSSNEDGISLFNILNLALRSDEIIILKIDNEVSMSSSFMNSSFGEIINKYGINIFKSNLKIKTSGSQFKRISNYINKYSELCTA